MKRIAALFLLAFFAARDASAFEAFTISDIRIEGLSRIAPGTVFGTQAAAALLTGTAEELPIAPVAQYSEKFTAVKSAYYEFGASLAHAVG